MNHPSDSSVQSVHSSDYHYSSSEDEELQGEGSPPEEVPEEVMMATTGAGKRKGKWKNELWWHDFCTYVVVRFLRGLSRDVGMSDGFRKVFEFILRVYPGK